MPVYQSSYRFVAANSIDDGFKTETFVSATNRIVNKFWGETIICRTLCQRILRNLENLKDPILRNLRNRRRHPGR